MNAFEFKVSIPVNAALERIDKSISRDSAPARLSDRYELNADNGKCVVSVYEKSAGTFGKKSKLITLTLTLDDFGGETRIHGIVSGGGESLSKFDWGAADTLAALIQETLFDCRL